MLDYYLDKNVGGKNESSYLQIKKPLYTSSIGRWKNDLTKKQQVAFMEVAGDAMRILNYA